MSQSPETCDPIATNGTPHAALRRVEPFDYAVHIFELKIVKVKNERYSQLAGGRSCSGRISPLESCYLRSHSGRH